jgi:hypothetical protein
LGNILAQKLSQPAWGQYRFSLRKFLFSNIQGRIPLTYGKISLP